MSYFPKILAGGYNEFKAGRFAKENRLYSILAESGQKPEYLVISCSDSRVSPEVIFSVAPGQIFVVRNIANLVPPYDIDCSFRPTCASIEFAVKALCVKHIIVLGHSGCGGIKAALDKFNETSKYDFIGKWLELLRPSINATDSNDSDSDSSAAMSLERQSIKQSIENLRTFPFVFLREKEGTLNLHGAWFDISSGQLWTMNPKIGDFSKLATE